MLAVITGLGTLIGLNVIAMTLYGIACGTSQFMTMLLRFSYFAWPIKLVTWFGCVWAALSVWEALA